MLFNVDKWSLRFKRNIFIVREIMPVIKSQSLAGTGF